MAFGAGEIFNPWFFAWVSISSGIALVSDLKYRKIYNWLTLPGVGVGILASYFFGGAEGVWDALLGSLLAFGLLFIPFFSGWMGGGDVKFFMLLGAAGGVRFVQETFILMLSLGGLLGLLQLTWSGKLVDFLKRTFQFLRAIFHPFLEVHPFRVDHSSQMPFAIPMGLSAVLNALLHPVQKWGWLWW